MIKKIFVNLIIINLFLFSFSLKAEGFLKFHKLNISSYINEKPIKIGKIRGNVDSYPYGFDYYANFKDGKIAVLIETFFFDNYGDHMSRFNNWARELVYISNPNNGCNNSEDKIYHAVTDNGVTHFNCFSLKVISEDEIWGPNFNNNQHLPMGQRKVTMKRVLSKNNYKIPDKIFRAEHYLYKGGKLIWVFYSIDSELLSNDLEKFFNQSSNFHQTFEKDLKYKDFMKIDF